MIKIEDFGEIAYGGAVTWAEWWDDKRVVEAKITNRDVFKKASTYVYLGIGLGATLMSVFGWMRQWETWAEHLSHGFLYDIPRFAKNMYAATQEPATAGSSAVKQANQILNQNRIQLLPAATLQTQRSYQPEFSSVAPHAF